MLNFRFFSVMLFLLRFDCRLYRPIVVILIMCSCWLVGWFFAWRLILFKVLESSLNQSISMYLLVAVDV